MSLFKPDAPTPPNPLQTAAAQTGTNVSTAVANSFLNNINQTTPTGSITFTPGNNYSWTDPSTNQTYNIPRWSMDEQLTPEGKQLQQYDLATQQNLGQMSQSQSGALKDFLGKPFNPLQTGMQLGDPMAYFNAYPDIQKAYQTDHLPGESPAAFATRHFQNNGMAEGRTAGSQFVTPPNAGQASSLNVGQAQGNLGFDAASYLQQNPDVAQSYASNHQPGETPEQYAARHYQESGMLEGRSGGINLGQQQTSLGDQGQQQSTFGDAGPISSTFGDAGDITRSYGPGDFSQDRSNVEQALFQRMQPQLQLDRQNLEARLADQGIQYGSPAYQTAMDQFDRQLADQRLAITAQAGQEQQRMMDMAAQRAGFENAAQQQAYTQAQGRGAFANQAQQSLFQQLQARGQFANEAQAQNYAQALQSGQFANAAQQQNFAQAGARNTAQNAALAQNFSQAQGRFNAQNAQRQQYLAEQYQQRNQPINEITSLLSGAQVQQPQQLQTPTNQIPTTDIAGILNNRFTQDMSIYQQQNQNFNQLMGGIFGMMGGLTKLSDRREKEDIERIGTVFAAADDDDKPSKLPVYQYSYKDDPASTRHIGPMAQDVEKVDPRAVTTRRGKKYIDTTRLGSILKVA